MTQKTLLYFFKINSDTKNEENTIQESKDIRFEDSPVKLPKKTYKRKNRISSSEGDSDDQSNDVVIAEKQNGSAIKKRCFNENADNSKNDNSKIGQGKTVSDLITGVADKGNGKSEKNKITHKKDGSYNPNMSKYDPVENASWNRDEKVPYYAFARTLEEIENVSARLKMIEIFSNYLRSVIVLSPDDLLPSIYLCLNKLGPGHEGIELGLAEQTLIRSISKCTGRTFAQIKNDVQGIGDIGLVAERSRSCQRLMFKPKALTVAGIFKKFKEIAKMTGQAAMNKKLTIIQTLFTACKGPEARFLIRCLNGKLRIGLAEQSVLQAVALACAMTPPGQEFPPTIIDASKSVAADAFKSEVEELAQILKTTYCECPNYDLMVPVLLNHGIRSLPDHCKLTPGLPLKPMLAQPKKGVEEVLSRFEGMEFTCEWKYDGERAQIHCTDDGVIKIYSRNQEDTTSKYPDIKSRIGSVRKDGVKSFILDCEAVAWNTENKHILPFQVLTTRKRKDASEADIKVPVCVFMFDLLYLNGKPLIRESFYERRQLLRDNFNHIEGQWMFPTSIDSSQIEEVQEFLEESIKGKCEGLIIKTLKEDATYEIAKRSRNWLKLKKDYLDGIGDTLDLTVLGGYFGKGKRTGTYGGFLVGCYDQDSEEYQSLCKLGTGFSDESLAAHTDFFKSHILPKAPSYYQHDDSLEPDHWFEPVQVWEIKCADLSLSPVHRAGIGFVDPEKGISLRFPRFLRVREDKKPEDSTTARQIIQMYNNQEQVKEESGKKTNFTEKDFY